MRVNVYTEELITHLGEKPFAFVYKEYVSSRTGQTMRNYGIRVYLKSHPDLHDIPGRDDDRSAVTIWCGEYANAVDWVQSLSGFILKNNPEKA